MTDHDNIEEQLSATFDRIAELRERDSKGLPVR